MARIRALAYTISAVVLLLAICLPSSPIASPALHIMKSSAQLVPSAPTSLAFGYGPTTLSSPQQGIPVYSTQDQMWAESMATNESVGITLVSPAGADVASSVLHPSTASLIYTFQSSDPEGVWTISISTPQGGNSLPMLLVNPSNHQLGLGLSYFSLQNDQLNLGFNVTETQDYNIEGCITSSSSNASALPVSVAIPTNLGSGSIQIAWNGFSSSIANLTVKGSVTQAFTFWYELYYDYAFSGTNTSQLVSRELQVARSDGALFTPSSLGTNATFSNQASLRDGRYILRSFFESASGLSVSESNVLLAGSGQSSEWLSLDSCNPFPIIAPSSFERSLSLAGNPSQWPTEFYYMYDVNGVDALGAFPLGIRVARIIFQGTPWNVSMSELSFSLENNSAIQTSSDYQGSLYVASSQFPVQLTVRPSFGGRQLQPINVSIETPFSQYVERIPIGRINAGVTENGSPLRGATIQLLSTQNSTLIQLSASSGNASFYVPSGSYYVRSSVGSATDIVLANVSNYGITNVVLSFATAPPVPPYGVYAAIVVAVIGVALNIFFWVVRPFMRYRFATLGSPVLLGKAFTRFLRTVRASTKLFACCRIEPDAPTVAVSPGYRAR